MWEGQERKAVCGVKMLFKRIFTVVVCSLAETTLVMGGLGVKKRVCACDCVCVCVCVCGDVC